MLELSEEQLRERYPNGFKLRTRRIRLRNGEVHVYTCRVAQRPAKPPGVRKQDVIRALRQAPSDPAVLSAALTALQTAQSRDSLRESLERCA